MADYVAYARTNYFRVKDRDQFDQWVDQFNVDIHADGDGSICLLFEAEIPFYLYDDDTGEERDVDFMGELSAFLEEGEIAIAKEVGFEKMRYLGGVAIAVNHEGDTIRLTIDDIYSQVAEEWNVPWDTISGCDY